MKKDTDFTFLPEELSLALVNHLKKKNLVSSRPIFVNDYKLKILAFLSQYQIIPRHFAVYEQAFTHSSFSRCNNLVDSNFNYERLEFLGDAIVNFCVAQYLFLKYPHANEGDLTCMRKVAIQKQAFYLIVKKLNLVSLLRTALKESSIKTYHGEKMYSNLFESLIAAIYIDQGLNKLEKFLGKTIYHYIDTNQFNDIYDHKSKLQEIAQKYRWQLIYNDECTKDRRCNLVFTTSIYLIKGNTNYFLASGSGFSKKKAHQLAAKEAIQELNKYL